MFSKVHPKATIIGTIALVMVALVTYVLPVLGLILCLFATIQVLFYGISLFHHLELSFDHSNSYHIVG